MTLDEYLHSQLKNEELNQDLHDKQEHALEVEGPPQARQLSQMADLVQTLEQDHIIPRKIVLKEGAKNYKHPANLKHAKEIKSKHLTGTAQRGSPGPAALASYSDMPLTQSQGDGGVDLGPTRPS